MNCAPHAELTNSNTLTHTHINTMKEHENMASKKDLPFWTNKNNDITVRGLTRVQVERHRHHHTHFGDAL